MAPVGQNSAPRRLDRTRRTIGDAAVNEDPALLQRILDEHRNAPHPGLEGAALRVHIALHAVIEKQLADGQPAEVRRALKRLTDGRLTRHEAVHILCNVASEEFTEVMGGGRSYDETHYVERLKQIM